MPISDSEMPLICHTTFIRANPRQLWETLTTPEGWDAWFTTGSDIDVRPGGKIRFRWRNFGVDRITGEDGGLVLHVQPGRSFAFQWQPASVPTTVTIEITGHIDGTLLSLTEYGYPANPDDLRVMLTCAAGWGEALTLLKFYLERGVTYGEVPPR